MGTDIPLKMRDIVIIWFERVVFSIIIMIVVLFFRRGIMGDKELPDLFRRRPGKRKEAVK